MAKNFFDLLGFSSDELADTMPERIVQAFHENGKDGVRQLMYEEMSKRMQRPLHIYCCDEEGHVVLTPFVYGPEQPGTPVELVRDNADLYRRYGDPVSSPDRGSPDGGAAPAPAPRKRVPGGSGAASKSTGPDAWERRFQELADFVHKHGFRPRRTAPEDWERHLHYWMGQQQRKLGHNDLSREQAAKLEALLSSTKGKKAEATTVRRPSGGSRSRGAAAAAAAAAAASGAPISSGAVSGEAGGEDGDDDGGLGAELELGGDGGDDDVDGDGDGDGDGEGEGEEVKDEAE